MYWLANTAVQAATQKLNQETETVKKVGTELNQARELHKQKVRGEEEKLKRTEAK